MNNKILKSEIIEINNLMQILESYCILHSQNEEIEIILSQIKIITKKLDTITSYILKQ